MIFNWGLGKRVKELETRLEHLERRLKKFDAFVFPTREHHDQYTGGGYLKTTTLADHDYVTKVHGLLNDLADILGYKRNPSTPANYAPNRWVKKGKEER